MGQVKIVNPANNNCSLADEVKTLKEEVTYLRVEKEHLERQLKEGVFFGYLWKIFAGVATLASTIVLWKG